MSSFYHGEVLELSIFGQSHSPAIGMSLSGLPAGFAIDMDELSAFLRRRAPGQNAWSTPRKEADAPEMPMIPRRSISAAFRTSRAAGIFPAG